MIQTTLNISGMMCSMCEAHINDAVRAAFPVRKVTSSRSKEETVILSDAPLDMEKLKQTIQATGYTFVSVREETVEKKGLFSSWLKRS